MFYNVSKKYKFVPFIMLLLLMISIPASYAQKTTTLPQLQSAQPVKGQPSIGADDDGFIIGTIFYDGDAVPNGDLDVTTGDFAEAGIFVTLLDENLDPFLYTVTLADGSYSFFYIPLGTYTVVVDTDSFPEGTQPVYDPDGVVDNMTEVTLTATEPELLDLNFSYTYPIDPVDEGDIVGTIFYDGDGVPNSNLDEATGDFPEESITVTLFDEDFVIVDEVITQDNGRYAFINIPLGTYTVAVDMTTLPNDAQPVYDPDGGADSMSEVTLTADNATFFQNFSYTYSISTNVEGRVSFWDGYLFDPMSEPEEDYPATGVEVTLTSPSGVVYTTVTDEDGIYQFLDVPVEGGTSDYVVEVHTETSPYTMIPFSGNVETVTLSVGESPNFGFFVYYAELLPIPIDVFRDRNRNGVPDSGTDSALAGVQVTVDGIDEEIIFRTVTTDSGGVATALVPGGPDYLITVDESSIPFVYQSAITADPDGVADGQTIYNSDSPAILFGYYETGCITVTVPNSNGTISIETWCID